MTAQVDLDYDSILKDASIQMAASHLSRRANRHSYTLASKRHSARIEKPRSIHPSPVAQERRRSASTAKYYPSLEDHYRAMFGEEASKTKEEPVPQRPFSWHPSSSHVSSQTDSPTTGESHMQPPFILPDTPMAYTTSSEMPPAVLPSQQYGVSHVSYGPPESIGYQAYQTSQGMPSWQSYFDDQNPVFSTFPSYAALPSEPTSWYTPDYSQLVQEQPQLLDSSAPFQNDLVPSQKPEAPRLESDEADEWDEDDGEVLVGLGLYDPPESSPPPFGLSEGRSLKLAETWQPPEPKDDDDDDDDDDDKSSEEDDEKEGAGQPQDSQAETVPARNLVGQSFFFEDEDSVAGEWWYRQLKQPTARHAGVGFGWLQTT